MQSKGEILANGRIKDRYYKMTIACEAIAQSALPGQFVMLKVGKTGDVFLRRPLGVHRVSGKDLELFYEVVGKGTETLSQRKSGELVDLLGPLGNGFDYSAGKINGRQPVLVAGGMGIAPLFFLAERIKQNYPLVLIGARAKDQLLCEKQFKKFGCDVKIATDDGSVGFPGRVTELLKKSLAAMNNQPSTIYACGPKLMLKEVSRISQKKRIPAQLSLEAHMACGIGACLGCAVNTKDGYKRVCKEGPVFAADELIY